MRNWVADFFSFLPFIFMYICLVVSFFAQTTYCSSLLRYVYTVFYIFVFMGTEEGRGVHKVLVGKPVGKRPMGRPRRRWEDNIKIDLQEVGRGCGDWMELAEDRVRWRALVSTVMNFRVP